jgi:L-lactate dehydrogenase
MRSKAWESRKVLIVGAGDVGATFAYALAQAGIADDIALMDLRRDQAEGQVLDLAHGLPFMPAVHIHVAEISDYGDADVIVITAGAKQKPEESRLSLVQRNANIVRQITAEIVRAESQAVILIVSNPVDVLTYVALKQSGWSKGRVIGSGTVLDTARFRYMLGRHCKIDPRNVHGYILGEHGDNQFAAWSLTHIAGNPVDRYCVLGEECGDWAKTREEIEREVRESAYHIINYKGATYYAVGLALVRIVGAILRNESSVLTVSTLLEGEYGIRDVCLSLPCRIGSQGVERILAGELSEQELSKLQRSADVLHATIRQLGSAP